MEVIWEQYPGVNVKRQASSGFMHGETQGLTDRFIEQDVLPLISHYGEKEGATWDASAAIIRHTSILSCRSECGARSAPYFSSSSSVFASCKSFVSNPSVNQL